MKIIFIAGGSGAGKTSLAHALVEALEKTDTTSQYLTMDDYFKEIPDQYHETIPAEYFVNNPDKKAIDHFRDHTNFDTINHFELGLLEQHLTLLNQGTTITKPIFDFPTNKRLTHQTITPPDYLVIEGLFALAFAKKLPDTFEKLTVFVGTSSYQGLIGTRTKRDVSERDRAPAAVIQQERKYVGPAFFKAILDSKLGVDIDILNDPHVNSNTPHPLDNAVDEIFSSLNLAREASVATLNQAK
jgi:uridine kinase